jgi:hypothetical protein
MVKPSKPISPSFGMRKPAKLNPRGRKRKHAWPGKVSKPLKVGGKSDA